MRHRTVREIMSCVEVCQQPPEASVRDACRLMAEHRCGSVLVVEGGRLIGIFTERDALERVFACGRDPQQTRSDVKMKSLFDCGPGAERIVVRDRSVQHGPVCCLPLPDV